MAHCSPPARTIHVILNAMKNLGWKSRFFAALRMTLCEELDLIASSAG